MPSVSKDWNSFGKLAPSDWHYDQIRQLLDRVDFSYLSDEALRIRKDATTSSPRPIKKAKHEELTCSIDPETFTWGMSHIVVEVKFSDGISWIARIRRTRTYGHTVEADAEREAAILSEITTMRLVALRTTIPVPTIYGFDVKRENTFGTPWMLMEALPGCHLPTSLAKDVPKEKWKSVTNQLATYLFELNRITFPTIGRITCPEGTKLEEVMVEKSKFGKYGSSLEWFYAMRRRATKSIRGRYEIDEDLGTACWMLKNALPSLVLPEYVYGPFPLAHLDLHMSNILIDPEDFKITGIIDWSGAQTVPMERFLVSPEFLAHLGASPQANARTIEFAKLFAKAFGKLEIASGAKKGCLMTDMFDMKHLDLVYRCTTTCKEDVQPAAQVVMKLLYGEGASWAQFVDFWNEVKGSDL